MEFGILGPLEVRSDAGAMVLGGSRPRAVLAVLLLHPNESVSAERLAVALFGEDAAAGAVKTVRVHVSRLRSALGDPDVLVTTTDGYRLRVRPDELDAERFERLVAEGQDALRAGQAGRASAVLRKALGLWRGPALRELADLPLAAAEVARLEEQRLEALEARVEADLAFGRHAELIGELRQLTATQPLRERLHGQLMLALYRAGRQADALEAYRPRARAARRRARDRARARAARAPAGDPPPGPAARPRGARARPARRRAARSWDARASSAELVAGLDAALAGHGRVVVDRRRAGDRQEPPRRRAGRARTRARKRWCSSVAAGRRAARPRTGPGCSRCAATCATPTRPRCAPSSELGAAEIARLVPELRTRLPDLADPPSLETEGARFRLFDATS